MNNDNYRIAENSRHEQQQEAQEASVRIEKAHGKRNSQSKNCGGSYEPANIEEIETVCETAPEALRDIFIETLREEMLEATPEALQEIVCETLIEKAWSGLLPDPDSFERYPTWVQHKMTEWNDAKILDESKRLDKLTDAAVSSIKLETILTFAINALFAILAFVAYLITESAVAFGFLSVPGITIAVNLWRQEKDSEQDSSSN